MVKNEINAAVHKNIPTYISEKEEVNNCSLATSFTIPHSRDDFEKPLILENKSQNCEICVSRRSTYFQTLFHLIKCHMGSGMLAVGDFFHNHSNLWLGPILTICLGIVCICDNHILATCTKEIKNSRQLCSFPTFPQTMEWAFESGPKLFQRCSSTIREVVKCLNVATQLGCCVVYFIFISSSLQSLLKMLNRHGIIMDEHLIIVIIFFPVVLTIFMCHLKFLTLFSVFASVFVFCAASLTLYISSSDLPPITPRPNIAHWSQIPLFFGTSIYCFEGIAKTLPQHSEVLPPARPVKHLSLLIVILAIVGSLFIVIAFICFIKFVDDVAGHNFEEYLMLTLTQNYLCSEVVHLTIALGLLFSYTLQFHIALMLVWPELVADHGPAKHKVLAELAVRLVLALSTFTAVEVIPRLGLCLSLTGAVAGTVLALLLPPLCDLALHWDHHSRPWRHTFDFFSIFLAIVGLFVGIFYTLLIIIKDFPDETSLRR